MRELKFRVWDKETEQMFTFAEIDSIDFTDDFITFRKNNKNSIAEYLQDFKNIELMQYTGLQDKNGIEIFEGDIVMHMGSLYTPVYERAIYMAYDVKQFNFNNKEPITQFNCIWRDDGCEIVGNIYENKELLQ